MNVNGHPTRTLWMEGTVLHLIHQPSLPHEFRIVTKRNYTETADAISTMVVRGAGAIGAAGAAGMAQAVAQIAEQRGAWADVQAAATLLRSTRPTAQNLFYGINMVLSAAEKEWDNPLGATHAALDAAQKVADEDAAACQAIGQAGLAILQEAANIITYCNAGWLAFVDWGSALAPVYAAKRAGLNIHVFVPETQPRRQGARLTAWELAGEEIPHTIIADGAIGTLCAKSAIHCVIVGADRIAANGDVANKIGTYTLAVLAKTHNIPFYVAAPTTTIDLECSTGASIPIEERAEDEVLTSKGWHPLHGGLTVHTAPENSRAFNPAFDITPADLVTAIITEKGVINPTRITDLFESS